MDNAELCKKLRELSRSGSPFRRMICKMAAQRIQEENRLDKTNGNAIRALIATDDALADYLIKRARTDGGQHLYGLWCDDKGACMTDPDEGCCDEWQRACVLRWVRSPAQEVQK